MPAGSVQVRRFAWAIQTRPVPHDGQYSLDSSDEANAASDIDRFACARLPVSLIGRLQLVLDGVSTGIILELCCFTGMCHAFFEFCVQTIRTCRVTTSC